MAAWGYEFYLLVLKVPLTRSRLSSLGDKIRIPARPCKILYVGLRAPIDNRPLFASVGATLSGIN